MLGKSLISLGFLGWMGSRNEGPSIPAGLLERGKECMVPGLAPAQPRLFGLRPEREMRVLRLAPESLVAPKAGATILKARPG